MFVNKGGKGRIILFVESTGFLRQINSSEARGSVFIFSLSILMVFTKGNSSISLGSS